MQFAWTVAHGPLALPSQEHKRTDVGLRVTRRRTSGEGRRDVAGQQRTDAAQA